VNVHTEYEIVSYGLCEHSGIYSMLHVAQFFTALRAPNLWRHLALPLSFDNILRCAVYNSIYLREFHVLLLSVVKNNIHHRLVIKIVPVYLANDKFVDAKL